MAVQRKLKRKKPGPKPRYSSGTQVRLTVFLPPHLHESLCLQAEHEDKHTNDIIREVLEEALPE